MKTVIQNVILFIILVLAQTLVLNNIQFLGYINPYVYILFILSLPIRVPQWVSIILAFLLGLTIDAFSNTMGLHAFATVLIAFLRNGIIKLFISFDENVNPTPSFQTFGTANYIKYVLFMVLLHHFVLFYLESFTFAHFWLVLFKIILSSLVSILIILGIRSVYKK